MRITNSIHPIEHRGRIVQVDSQERSAFAARSSLDFPSGLLSTFFEERFAQSIGDHLGPRGICFQRNLLGLGDQIIRQMDGYPPMLRHLLSPFFCQSLVRTQPIVRMGSDTLSRPSP
jgi:hypothetical protein